MSTTGGYRRPGAKALIIRDGMLVTMNARRDVYKGDLVIMNGRIITLGADMTVPPVQADSLDASGCLVVPGFVQAHVHTVQTLARGHAEDLELLPWLRDKIWPYEAALDEGAVRAAVALGCTELLRGGTTSILDMGTVHHTDAVFETVQKVGLRATIGKAMMDAGDGVPARLREDTLRSLDESVALARRWHGAEDNRLRYGFAPRFVLSCSESLLCATVDAARQAGCVIHTHASENQGEMAAVRADRGDDNIAYLHSIGMTGKDVVLAHCVWPTEKECQLLAKTGSSVAHCPSSNLKLASGVAPVPELLERGVNVALGADGAPCNNNLDVFTEMRLAALIQKPRLGPAALKARQIVEMATLGGARALGLSSEIGSLEPGKRADVVILDPERSHVAPTRDPYTALVYALRAGDVRDVIVDGRLLVRLGSLQTLDESEVIARGREAHLRIYAKL